MTRTSVREYAASLRERYRRATRTERGRLLDEFCATTGYHRKAAIRLLRQPGAAPRRRPVAAAGAEGEQPPAGVRRGRGRPRVYGPLVVAALHTVWEASGQMGVKRLAPFLPELVAILERHRELEVSDEVRTALLAMRPSTMEQALAAYRRTLPQRGSRRSSGSTPLLRTQIPIRTFAEWQDAPLGSVQADLVAHCGDEAEGFFLSTLTVIDVRTGWTVCRPVRGKAMGRVRAAVHRIRGELPMALVALHTDNGSEFINQQLRDYCQQEGIQLTRGRPYRKNDQAYVEQRNWTAVRQWVGYARYRSRAAYTLLERLYRYQQQYLNFFQPIRKLVAKERVGAKVRKQFDPAATPYQRLLATQELSAERAEELARLYRVLNPVKLRQWIADTERELWAQRELPRTARARKAAAAPIAEDRREEDAG